MTKNENMKSTLIGLNATYYIVHIHVKPIQRATDTSGLFRRIQNSEENAKCRFAFFPTRDEHL